MKGDTHDEKVLATITKTPNRNVYLQPGCGLDMRQIDRALQRLRKKGVIEFRKGPGGGWVLR